MQGIFKSNMTGTRESIPVPGVNKSLVVGHLRVVAREMTRLRVNEFTLKVICKNIVLASVLISVNEAIVIKKLMVICMQLV